MDNAYFIMRAVAQPIPMIATCHGPFANEQSAISAASVMPPGSYQIFGPAKGGKTFTIAPPVVTFGESK